MGPRGLEPIAPWPVLVRWAAHRLLTGWRGRTIIPEMRSVSHQDEQIRDALTDGIKKANIDARNLSVEVVDRSVIIKGTVPTPAERDRLASLVGASAGSERTLQWQVSVSDNVH